MHPFPQTETVQRLSLSGWKGLNTADHPTLLSRHHSPDLCNLLPAMGGILQKRTGVQTLVHQSGEVFGLFPCFGGLLVHVGTVLGFWQEESGFTPLAQDVSPRPSAGFLMRGRFYLLDGKCYRLIEQTQTGFSVTPVHKVAYIPLTRANAKPDGTGGQALEAVNLLSPYRRNTFAGDGNSTTFQLDTKNIDNLPVTATVEGTQVEVATIDRTLGKISLSAPPPSAGGMPNVEITFGKLIKGAQEQIDQCQIFGIFGGKNDTRVFVSGNPARPGVDWQSGLYDPTYFPDTGYTQVGSDASPIVGYAKYRGRQIVCKGKGDSATQFVRSFELLEDGTVRYPLAPAGTGAECISARSIATASGKTVMLSSRSLLSFGGSREDGSLTFHNCSRTITPTLEAEGKQDACGVFYLGDYYLATQNRLWVAANLEDQYTPDWYPLEGLSATCLAVLDDRLFIGTKDGRLTRMKLPSDPHPYLDDTAPILARYRSPTLLLGSGTHRKTLRALFVSLLPAPQTSVTVRTFADDVLQSTQTLRGDTCSFFSLDFHALSFRTVKEHLALRLKRRHHRKQSFAIELVNDVPNEPMALLNLELSYTISPSTRTP